jgi:hypothetical protein
MCISNANVTRLEEVPPTQIEGNLCPLKYFNFFDQSSEKIFVVVDTVVL